MKRRLIPSCCAGGHLLALGNYLLYFSRIEDQKRWYFEKSNQKTKKGWGGSKVLGNNQEKKIPKS